MFDFLSRADHHLLDSTMISLVLVLSVAFNFTAGLFSLAPVGFMAIGAYVSALTATEWGLAVPLAIALGTLAAATVAALFAAPVLSLKGIYLALGSLALGQIVVVIIGNLDVTGGTLGYRGIPREVISEHILVVLVVLMVLAQLLHRSYAGRAMRAIRLDERTAAGHGVNVRRYRGATFVVSAAVAALAGALEAHWSGSIAPSQYNFSLLVMVFTYALVGGVGHWAGPVLTAVVVTIAREQLGFAGSDWEEILYGVLLVVTMIVAPKGLSDRELWHSFAGWIRRRAGRGTVEQPSAPTPPSTLVGS